MGYIKPSVALRALNAVLDKIKRVKRFDFLNLDAYEV